VGQNLSNEPPSAAPGSMELPSPASPTAAELSSRQNVRAQDISSVPSHWVSEVSWAELESLRAQGELPAEAVHASGLHSTSATFARAELASTSQPFAGIVQTSELYSSSSSGGAVRAELGTTTTQVSSSVVQMSELSLSAATARVELALTAQLHTAHQVSSTTGWTVREVSGSVSMQGGELSSGSVRREVYSH